MPPMVGSPNVIDLTVRIGGPNGTKKVLKNVAGFSFEVDGLHVRYPKKFAEQGIETSEVVEGDVQVLRGHATKMWE